MQLQDLVSATEASSKAVRARTVATISLGREDASPGRELLLRTIVNVQMEPRTGERIEAFRVHVFYRKVQSE